MMDHCLKQEQALQQMDSKDTDASDLFSELPAIARRVPKWARPQDVLNLVCKDNLTDNVPNTFIVLRILLTLTVSVASQVSEAFPSLS